MFVDALSVLHNIWGKLTVLTRSIEVFPDVMEIESCSSYDLIINMEPILYLVHYVQALRNGSSCCVFALFLSIRDAACLLLCASQTVTVSVKRYCNMWRRVCRG